ncbi:hypothetical protein GOV11_02670 [Candidatus Woesearchaeota archaeon]|nr:hypothetical protein [Candidatus Woesearchaeota archaeon]
MRDRDVRNFIKRANKIRTVNAVYAKEKLSYFKKLSYGDKSSINELIDITETQLHLFTKLKTLISNSNYRHAPSLGKHGDLYLSLLGRVQDLLVDLISTLHGQLATLKAGQYEKWPPLHVSQQLERNLHEELAIYKRCEALRQEIPNEVPQQDLINEYGLYFLFSFVSLMLVRGSQAGHPMPVTSDDVAAAMMGAFITKKMMYSIDRFFQDKVVQKYEKALH